MFDNLQGFSICTTCQLLLLQLAYDLMQVPTVELQVFNTDAIKFYVDEVYKEETDKVIHNWEKQTGFEMEEDHIVKSVMVNVNNYVEICQVGDNDYEVHYKGVFFRGKHKFEWDKEKKIFHYEFKNDLESNSLTICSEALLKNLLFDIPPEEVIYNCNDIFRFQKISHVGHTYVKCVQESENGDIELQNNNRIYAGKKPSGAIIKVKADGRRDSLADQPPYPLIDNDNHCTIDDIDKEWYVEVAKDWINRFRGIKRLEDYKVSELKEMCENKGIELPKKIKKDGIIEILKEFEKNSNKVLTNNYQYSIIDNVKGGKEMANEELKKENEELKNQLTQILTQKEGGNMGNEKSLLYRKINEFRKEVRKREFIFDKELPTNMGGGEYYSIDQLYDAVQDISIQIGLDFSYDIKEILRFDMDLVKPANGGMNRHVATVMNIITFTDIDTGESKEYYCIGQGSDTIDKAVTSASSMGFRNWFYKNFTPKKASEEDLYNNKDNAISKPKVPVYIPETRKEEIKKEVVTQEQHTESDDEDIKKIIENIEKIRKASGNETYGEKTIAVLNSGTLNSTDIMKIDLQVKNKLEEFVIGK